jgi:hypothetical protein
LVMGSESTRTPSQSKRTAAKGNEGIWFVRLCLALGTMVAIGGF